MNQILSTSVPTGGKKHKRRNVSRETFSTNRKNMFHVKHLVDKKMKKCYTGLKSKER